jgi:hypothetical protein
MPKAYQVMKRLYETRNNEFQHIEWRLGVLYTHCFFDALQVGNVIYDSKTEGTELGVEGFKTFNIQKEYYTVCMNPKEIDDLVTNEYVKEIEISRYQLFAWPKDNSFGNMQVEFSNDGSVNAFWMGEFDKIKQVRDAIETVREEYKEVSFIDVVKGHGLFINAFEYWKKRK